MSNCQPGIDYILAEIIPAEGEILRSEIHKLINFICKREGIALAVRADHYCSHLQHG
jgi:hypothetical protein